MAFTLPFTAEALLNIGRSELGQHEDPPGSNKIKYNAWAGLQGQPWCVTLWRWCIFTAGGVKAPFSAYNPDVKAWAKRSGVWLPPSEMPQPGDFIQYAFPGENHVPNHFGIVEKVHGIRDVDTIEGNTDAAGGRTGGQVMRKHRTAADHIDGYIRPTYAAPQAEEHDDNMILIQVTAGDDKDKVFLVVGDTHRQQDKTSADRLIHAGIRYVMMDDIAWEQVRLSTDAAKG